jgi:hypothetical protein
MKERRAAAQNFLLKMKICWSGHSNSHVQKEKTHLHRLIFLIILGGAGNGKPG